MLRIAFWIIVAALFNWCAGAFALDAWGKTRKPDGYYDAIIVAGCSVYPNGRPSPALEWRVRKAVDLWRLGSSKRVVFTGGMGDFPPTEAEAGAALATELGLPQSARHSKNTRNRRFKMPKTRPQFYQSPRTCASWSSPTRTTCFEHAGFLLGFFRMPRLLVALTGSGHAPREPCERFSPYSNMLSPRFNSRLERVDSPLYVLSPLVSGLPSPW